jgi:hypothetical protein
MNNQEELQLTEREMLIAKTAAKMAVKEIQDSFYKEIGKGVVTKAFIWIGLAIVGFLAGKGYIKFP